MFNGISIRMFWRDTERHFAPHIHAKYCEHNAVFAIESGSVLSGKLPPRQTRLVQAWIELRRDELVADWKLAVDGATLKPIEPLR
jgi:Domain of unknown function (DUF4160)